MMNLPFQGNYWGGMFGGWGISIGFGILGIIFVAAIIALKGYTLWHAAKRDEKWWFVALLLINTIGILELCYLYFVVKKWHGDKNVTHTSSNNSTTV